MFLKDIALVVLGSVLTLIVERVLYRWQKRDERREGPHVVIAKVVKDGQALLEVRNIGTDSVSDMDITIAWDQDGHSREKRLEQFYSPEQDVRMASPSHVELLGHLERYYVGGLPQWAENGIVAVTVTGLGVQSKKLYETHNDVVVGLPSTST